MYILSLQELLEVKSKEVLKSADSGAGVAAYLKDVRFYFKIIVDHLAKICTGMREDVFEGGITSTFK